MTDYTELVKALRGKFIAYDVTGNHNSAQLYKDAAAAIEALQEELIRICKQLPKRGQWIEESCNNQHNLYRCSVCGLEMLTNPDYAKKHKYCFACGAKMEVQE